MEITELIGRFFLLLLSAVILYFFSNRNDNATINPLIIIVGFCTFSLSYLFTRIDLSIGAGFGLFAIFSVLRFRSQTFSLNAIVFLFTIITLSILDMMYPLEKIEFLLFFQAIILGFYIISSFLVNKSKRKHFQSTVIIIPFIDELILKDDKIKEIVESKIDLTDFEYNIVSINTITKEVHIKVNY